MTTKVLTGTYVYGDAYTIGSGVTLLSITTTGYVQGELAGDFVGQYITILNNGRINNPIDDSSGVYLGKYGGSVINGGAADTAALIKGSAVGVESLANGPISVTNYGRIIATAPSSAGVEFGPNGVVTNGSGVDTTALISGAYGVFASANTATVTNFGTIIGTGTAFGDASAIFVGGGRVTNGSNVDKTALIAGFDGVILNAAGTVANFGTILSTGTPSGGDGVDLTAGGRLTNGSATDQTALVDGYRTAVAVHTAAGAIVNYGTLEGQGGEYSVYLDAGSVTNGASGDRTALIEGSGSGIVVESAAGTVTNFGSIIGQGAFGVALDAGGSLTNGAVNGGAALIEGYSGIALSAGGYARNLGTIAGSGLSHGYGVVLAGTATSLVNGASNDKAALIDGYFGARLYGASTLTNFGVISGANGIAVEFVSAAAELVVEAGSVFDGAVDLDGGKLDLASGTGTLSGLAGGDVTVSVSMPTKTFDDFGALEIGKGASFTMAGNGGIASGSSLIDDGAVSLAGTLSSAGTLTTAGTLTGAGTLAITGGPATFGAGTALTIARVAVSGTATKVEVTAPSLNYANIWTQTAGTLSVASGERVNFTGVGDAFSGTLTGAGTIAFIGGSDSLTGATLTATTLIINAPTVTLAGAIDLTTTLTATTKDLIIAAGGATLSGGGTLALTNLATNTIVGASSAATLTNDDKIEGAGQLGDGTMTLHNEAGALIEDDGSVALTIDTGANTIINAGTLQAGGAGGLVIKSALDNTGDLVATPGTLTVDGAVTGTGHVNINGGVADFAGTFSQNVFFAGTSGALELAHSQTYAGAISGLSKSGTNSLDLEDIQFADAPTWSYSGTTTSGVLTVKDSLGHTAKITLEGDYLTSTFVLSAGPGTGTKVVDPTVATPAASHRFIASAAAFGALKAAGPLAANADVWRPPPVLAAPLFHNA